MGEPKVSIDPMKQTAKLGFDVGIGKASISVGTSGPEAELEVNLGSVGKAGISLSPSGPGMSIGLGPVSIGVGPNSASGFESMTWDFGVAKQTTKQVGCTVARETWIVGGGVVESESWTDPKCEPDPKSPAPAPNTPGIEGNIPGPKHCKGGSFALASSPAWGPNQVIGVGEAMAADLASINAGASHEFGKQDEASDNRRADYYFGIGLWKTELRKGVKQTWRGHWHWIDEHRPDTRLPMVGRIKSEGAVGYSHSYNILYYYSETRSGWFTSGGFNHSFTITNVQPPPACPRGNIAPPPQIPNTPPRPMDKGCCAMIKELHEFFQVERIKNKGFEIPNRLQIAGGEGESTYNNWMEITEALIRVSDHLGLHPLNVSVADMRSDIEGNQTFGANFASGTQGIQAAMSQLWSHGGKFDTITTFLYKLSVLTVQMMLLNCKQSGDLQALKAMIGGSTIPVVETVRTPLNIAAGVKQSTPKKTKGKGFGKNKKQSSQPAVTSDTPEFDPAMADPNSLFPEFLKNRDNDIVIDQFDGNKDIYDLLTIVIMKLEKLEYRG